MNVYSEIRNYFTGRSKSESLRSIRKRNISGKQIVNQELFDHIYACIFSEDRLVVMRSIAAAVKITAAYPEYLLPHKESLLDRPDHSEKMKFK